MIDDLKPYPEYKQTGLSWLARIPAHWRLVRTKSVALLNPRKSEALAHLRADIRATFLPMERVGSDGRVDVSEALRTSRLWNSFTYFRRGDVLVAKITPCFENGKGAHLHALPTEIGFGSTEFHVLRAGRELDPRFLCQLTQAHFFRDLGTQSMTGSAGQQRVPESFLADYPSALPPLDEQAAIVRFVEALDARIENASRAKRKLISLLNEQKQVIIHHAVSRGLDPALKLKPSGISWLGEVPEHWVTVSLRQRYHQCLGKMVDAKKVTGKHLIPYLRNIDVRWGHINTTNLPLIDIAPHERERYTVKPGDLLVCEGRHLGRSAIWKGGIEVCGFQKALHRLRPISREVDDPRFLQYVMVVANATDAFHRNKIDNAIPHLTGEMLRAHRFAFPPIHEQREIAKYLESHLQQHERAIARAEREIALLREYRTTLTADVVTGKLDVREAVKSLPISAEQPTAPDGADVPDDTDDELTEFAE